MATLASDQLKAVSTGVIKHCGLASAVNSGIVPDDDHLDGGGYHCSVEDLRRFGNQGDYSNVRPDDKNLNVKYGAAFDVSLNEADMRKVYARVHAVWADHSDPRRKFVNAINCWDGSGDAVRLDFVANVASYASDDHKWHTHGELRRRYVLNDQAARAVVSIYAGQSKAAWIEQEDDDVEIVDLDKALRDGKSSLAGISKAIPWQYTGGGIPAGMSTLSVLNAIYGYSQSTAAMVKLIADRDEVDETKLGAEIGKALGPAVTALVAPILAEIADKTGTLTPEQVAEAVEAGVREVLREGVEG